MTDLEHKLINHLTFAAIGLAGSFTAGVGILVIYGSPRTTLVLLVGAFLGYGALALFAWHRVYRIEAQIFPGLHR